MANISAQTVELRGAMGLRDAAGLAASLVAALDAGSAVTVTAEHLSEADISILQVLVAAGKSAAKAGKTLTLQAPADGTLRLLLIKAGFVDAAGQPKTAEGSFWTSGNESKTRAA